MSDEDIEAEVLRLQDEEDLEEDKEENENSERTEVIIEDEEPKIKPPPSRKEKMIEHTVPDIDDKEINTSKIYNINSFLTYLQSNKLRPQKLYAEDGFYRLIECLCEKSGEKIIIYILSKYSIKVSNKHPFFGVKKMDESNFQILQSQSEHYSGIEIDEDNKTLVQPEFKSKSIEQYKPIEVNLSNRKLYKHIKKSKNQLERFKNCTSTTKYKMAIVTNIYVSIINRHNEVITYIPEDENYDNIEREVVCVVVDLETLIKKINILDNEIIQFYSSFFTILNKAHTAQLNDLKSTFNKLKNIPDIIASCYVGNQNLLLILDSSYTTIKTTEARKDKLLKKNKDYRKKLGQEVQNAFSRNDNELQLDKMCVIKEEALGLYRKIKDEYTTKLLNFDTAIFESISAMQEMYTNFLELNLKK